MQDPLTELGNRTWFVQKVQERLAAWSAEGNGQFAVLFCDLDGFKDVNDSLGHAAGDRLLVTVAARMREKLHLTSCLPASVATSSPSAPTSSRALQT